MTRPEALPGAALRESRTAAGRRALRVALLVGGLFALGVLWGEQAHAAEHPAAPTSPTSTTSTTVTASPTSGILPVVPPAGHHGAVAVPKAITHPVIEAVTQPVGKLVGTVTEGLAEARAQLPRPPAQPAPSTLPTLPASLPLISALLETSSPPGLPSSPDPPSSSGEAPPAPDATTPPSAAESASAERAASNGPTERPAPAGPPLPPYSDPNPYEPRFIAVGSDMGTGAGAGALAADGTRHRPAHAGHTGPARRAPAGDPRSVLVGQSTLDAGTSRHGDAYAVAPGHHQMPLRLLRGTVARAEAAGTRGRYRDIPVSPA
ncbi:hypothetical protein ACWCQK_30060 [Streptomyces sp. NPDC002306]